MTTRHQHETTRQTVQHAEQAIAHLRTIVDLRDCGCGDCSICAARTWLDTLTCGRPAEFRTDKAHLCADCAEEYVQAGRRRSVRTDVPKGSACMARVVRAEVQR